MRIILRQIVKNCVLMLAILMMLVSAREVTAQNLSANNQRTSARVDVTVSKSKLQVAEPFAVDVTVVAPKGTQVTWPPIGTRLGEFEIVDHRDIADVPTVEGDGRRIWKRQLMLESIVTGDLTVPAMEIGTRTDGRAEVIRSEAVLVHVASVLENRGDPTKFRDIRSVVDLPEPRPRDSSSWLWWVGGGAGLLALGGLAIAMLARRKSWLTPAAWATQQLTALRDSELVRRGDTEAATSQLSEILRDYLQMQFEIAAPRQTTSELLDTITHRALLSPDQVKRFKALFEATDLAKFAGLQLPPSELNLEIDRACELIEATASEIVHRGSERETP